ncbi:oxygen-independent coproporphyrinogen III oxidase [uncultured Methylibium sp.]|uniref:oxygen-independent coproporphyrinogen III oxidase n=1 Tax=uncultured Methylibium sp. TaxID=381093 RepID=UPI0025FF64BD|nr:oxygen-independent coproporphyrinogen III oxidase [uncultured Methylibium sp.]
MNTETVAAPDRVSQLLAGLDVPGPRYTSYPTADRFDDDFGAARYREALAARAAAGQAAAPLSIYVHVPFCESICYYCACNKVVTRHHEQAQPYLAALEREIALHVGALGRGQPVSQLHLGGGSPTFLSNAELDRLLATLRAAFAIAPQAELSIEVDPRTVDAARLRHLAALGFNRLSFGVQDFDPEVQRAVHREQPYEQVHALMREARALRFGSINVDLIYGLPRQTPESFAVTVAQVAGLRPDRIALYAYAHLPQRFKPQRRIHAHELPIGSERVHMLRSAISGFQRHGYAYIGMDHFALPDDPLAFAKRQGRLHRNFQGYSTQPDCDLIGLGVSAIGQVGGCYAQNAKTLAGYEAALARGVFATERGLAPDADDRLRRTVIMALMCQGRVDFDAIGSDVAARLRGELERLRVHEAQGLVTVEPGRIELTPLGWYFVRAIAMVFDRHLQEDAQRDRYSRVV